MLRIRSAFCFLSVLFILSVLSHTAFATPDPLPLTPEERERVLIAENPETPADVLRDLARDDHQYVRRAVARNRNTPSDVFYLLSTDPNFIDFYFFGVRPSVAKNPHVPVDLLYAFVEDSHGYVRRGVVENPNVPADLLRIFAHDPKPDVRIAVAENSRTPSYVLCFLSDDSSDVVRKKVEAGVLSFYSAYFNTSYTPTPEDDACWYMLGFGFGTASPADLRRFAGDDSALVRQAVADHADTPVDVLRILAKDSDVGVRLSVAKNSNTPTDVLRLLAEGDTERFISQFVRLGIAQNPNVTLDILHMLKHDHFFFAGISRNDGLSVDSLQAFFSDIDLSLSEIDRAYTPLSIDTSYSASALRHPETSMNMLRFLAQHPDFDRSIARDPRAPSDVLRMLAEKGGFEEDIAQNPGASASLLHDLAPHSDPLIQKEIDRNLNARPFPFFPSPDPDLSILQFVEHLKEAELTEKGTKSPSAPNQATYWWVVPFLVAGALLTIIFHPSLLNRKKKRSR